MNQDLQPTSSSSSSGDEDNDLLLLTAAATAAAATILQDVDDDDDASSSSSTPLRIRGGGSATRRPRRSTSPHHRSSPTSSTTATADYGQLDRVLKKAKKKKKRHNREKERRDSARTSVGSSSSHHPKKSRHRPASPAPPPRKPIASTDEGGKDNSIVIDDSDSSVSATSDEEVARARERIASPRQGLGSGDSHSSQKKKKKKKEGEGALTVHSRRKQVLSSSKLKKRRGDTSPDDSDENDIQTNFGAQDCSSSSLKKTPPTTLSSLNTPQNPSRRDIVKISRTKKKGKLKKRSVYDRSSDSSDSNNNEEEEEKKQEEKGWERKVSPSSDKKREKYSANHEGSEEEDPDEKKREERRKKKKEAGRSSLSSLSSQKKREKRRERKEREERERRHKRDKEGGRLSLSSSVDSKKRRSKRNKQTTLSFPPSSSKKKKAKPKDAEIIILDSDDDDDEDDKKVESRKETEEKDDVDDGWAERVVQPKQESPHKEKKPANNISEVKPSKTTGLSKVDKVANTIAEASSSTATAPAAASTKPTTAAAKPKEQSEEEKEQQRIMDEIQSYSAQKKKRLLELEKGGAGAAAHQQHQNEMLVEQQEENDEGAVDPTSIICWSCEVPLQNPLDDSPPPSINGDGTMTNPEEEDDDAMNLITQPQDKPPPLPITTKPTFGHYAAHAHPLLMVSTCSSCVDRAYAVEDDVRHLIALKERREKGGGVRVKDSDEEDGEEEEVEMDICSWCAGACTTALTKKDSKGKSDEKEEENGEEELDQLLLCDACPRTFCVRCVTLAHGGGTRGRDAVKALMEDASSKWACIHCNPPKGLRSLQMTFFNVKESAKNDTIEQKAGDEDKNSDDDSDSVAKLIDELNEVEDGVEEAEAALESATLEEKRKAIEEELRSMLRDEGEKEFLEELVQEELEAYQQSWMDHHTRLTDSVMSIQEAMEAKGISLDAFYKVREKQKKGEDESGKGEDDGDRNEDGEGEGREPAWKNLADKELDKRDKEMGLAKGEFWGASGYKSKNPKYAYDLDDLSQSDIDEIEDINTLEGTVMQMKYLAESHKQQRNQWSMGQMTDDDVRILTVKAIPFERIELEDRINVDELERKVVGEEDDLKREMKTRAASMRGKRGGRVVLNELNMFSEQEKAADRKKRKEQKRQQGDQSKKRRISSAGTNGIRDASTDPNTLSDMRNKKKRRVATQLVSGGSSRSSGPMFDSGLYLDDVDSEMESQEVSETFDESELSLPLNRTKDDQNLTVSISKILFKALKSHQIEGVKFIWENVCRDLFPSDEGVVRTPQQQFPFPPHMPLNSLQQQPLHILPYLPYQTGGDEGVRGCILAHNMGLGKSLQVVSVLHTLLTHPILELDEKERQSRTCPNPLSSLGAPSSPWEKSKRLIHRALLVVPVNTLTNWEDEFKKWFKRRKKSVKRIRVLNLNNTFKGIERNTVVQKWMVGGGVLLTSSECLTRHCKELLPDAQGNTPLFNGVDGVRDMNWKAFVSPGPDIIVLDEAHTMLKNSNTGVFKTLNQIQTKRRIALTGTPLQNNLLEYYRMCSFVRPNCLGSEYEFTRNFHDPIMGGMAADSSDSAVELQEKQSKELHHILKPFVQRCGSSVLAKELPLLQQAVIHVRQSKLQVKLYRAFRRYKKETSNNSFFHQYHRLRPVNNHPACLFTKGSTETVLDPYQPQNGFKNSDDENEEWWESVITKDTDFPQIEKPSQGGKMCLLLEIIARADILGEKVVVFSQCLKTLNFIEQVLKSSDWGSAVPSISSLSPGKIWGPWRKNFDYLRIDGATTASERGELITSFNDKSNAVIAGNSEDLERHTKVFLISTLAGGIGINLVAASRVVLYDSHWNPAIDEQALYRCYRYGQEKNVFVYRLLTEGTMEEKIYSRSVNKSSLAMRVIDQKFPERSFTSNELTNLLNTDTWVQCDKCDKWRMLPPEADVDNLPDKWYCEMNIHDEARSKCSAKERDARWYAKFFEKRFLESMELTERESIGGTTQSTETPRDSIGTSRESVGTAQNPTDEKKESCTQRDEILRGMLSRVDEDENGKSKKSWISKYYFHDTLLEDSNEGGDDERKTLGIDSVSETVGQKMDQMTETQVKTTPKNSVSGEDGKISSTKKEAMQVTDQKDMVVIELSDSE